jgi:hypothetical protein
MSAPEADRLSHEGKVVLDQTTAPVPPEKEND